MKSLNQFGKVLWAIDPSTETKGLQFATFKALAKLTAGSKSTIEPVAVLSPDQLKVPRAAFQGQSKKYELEVESTLKSWVKELKNPRLTSPTLLVQDIYSRHATLDVLLRYARETGASLIAVGTHNKKGFERLFVGSFAETLILKSDIPLLIVNPKSPAPRKISRILFPTDFSNVSRAAFERVLPLAKSLNAKVTLYFKFEYLLPETVEMMKLSAEYSRHFRADLENRRRAATQWVEAATSVGIQSDIILDETPSFVHDGIVKSAKKAKADMIAMASNSGVVASALMGSVARQVVRMSTIPVWVIHPQKQSSRPHTSQSESPSKNSAANTRVR